MKLSVLALDFDGTIARDDRLDPSVRDAIADARRVGRIVAAVTSRYDLTPQYDGIPV